MKQLSYPIYRALAAVFIATVLAGCAGTNFKQPDPSALRLGEAKTADIVRVMGEPERTGEIVKNSQKLKLLTYVYASVGGQSLHEDVVPARAMSFATFDDVLVSQTFISSFKDDATEFDDSKVALITKGKTTRSGVIDLVGKPTGQAIYPIAKTPGERAIMYSYSQVVRAGLFKMKVYHKTLTVSLDSSDVVTEVEYLASGEK